MNEPKPRAEARERRLSPAFMTDLSEGKLKGLVETIKKDADLLMCFRGGLKAEYVNVYYRGHSLFKISVSSRGYVVEFDFNHARYTKDWQGALNALQPIGYRLNSDGELQKYKDQADGGVRSPRNVLHRSIARDPLPQDFWQSSSLALKRLVDDFFDPDKTKCRDYFKDYSGKQQSNKTKQQLLEKVRQQQIMKANQSLSGPYFIYDMEYAQARNSKDEKVGGRFDMLALRRMADDLYRLVFVELKSTKSACVGKSGIREHESDLSAYTKSAEYLEVRRKDAIGICEDYAALFLDGASVITIDDKLEILFIFTDEAKPFASEVSGSAIAMSLEPPYKLSLVGGA